MGNSIDPLAASIQQSPVLMLIVAVILVAICALSVATSRQRRRLAAIKTQLDNLSHAVDSLRIAHEGLLVRSMNNPPRSRKSPKSSGPSSGALEEKTKQPDENPNRSALYVVAPKTSPE